MTLFYDASVKAESVRIVYIIHSMTQAIVVDIQLMEVSQRFSEKQSITWETSYFDWGSKSFNIVVAMEAILRYRNGANGLHMT